MELLRDTAAAWGIQLSREQLDRFERYYRELIEWNQRLNLTRITEYRAVQIRHFLDSLALLPAIREPAERPARVVDVGSGAGLPGLALKLACPRLRITLVESVQKKAAFLRHLVAVLELTEVEVVADRAENVAHHPSHREAYDYAVARALAELPVELELTLPFVRPGGRVLLPRKGDLAAEVAAASRALAILGGRYLDTLPVHLPGEENGRGVVVIEKLAPTDGRYPRRPGLPAKRPLR